MTTTAKRSLFFYSFVWLINNSKPITKFPVKQTELLHGPGVYNRFKYWRSELEIFPGGWILVSFLCVTLIPWPFENCPFNYVLKLTINIFKHVHQDICKSVCLKSTRSKHNWSNHRCLIHFHDIRRTHVLESIYIPWALNKGTCINPFWWWGRWPTSLHRPTRETVVARPSIR